MNAPATRARSNWLHLGGALAASYFAVAAFAWFISDGMLYQPAYGSRRRAPGEERIRVGDGTELSALFLGNPTARTTLWYFHGNAEDLGDIEPRLRALRDLGFSVFAFDYPGYGVSGGRPSESAINRATLAALAHLRTRHGVRSEQIIAFGRSMGGGPAAELATREPLAGLILQSPFMSVYRVMTHWRVLPFDKFENLRKIGRVRCPVLVMHGEADDVIPFYHGAAVFAAVAAPKQSLWVEGAGHNNFEEIAGDGYWNAIRDFTAKIESGGFGAARTP